MLPAGAARALFPLSRAAGLGAGTANLLRPGCSTMASQDSARGIPRIATYLIGDFHFAGFLTDLSHSNLSAVLSQDTLIHGVFSTFSANQSSAHTTKLLQYV